MDKANRQLRRASGFLGFLARLWLFGFWTVVLAVIGFVIYAFVA